METDIDDAEKVVRELASQIAADRIEDRFLTERRATQKIDRVFLAVVSVVVALCFWALLWHLFK